jgi:O-methyltransferase
MTTLRELARDSRKLAAGYLWRLAYLVPPPLPPDYEPELVETIKRVRRYTMTTPRRLAALCDGVSYVVDQDVEGGIAECGVWRGGSMMAVALTLLRRGVRDRDLYLFDTFEGMPGPTEADVRSPYDGYSPHRRWRAKQRGEINRWHYVTADAVRDALLGTGYDPARIHLVKGRVEDTLPEEAPPKLSLLRLDTDWYASTRHELIHLYPRLAEGGVLVLDDYGHYEGARRAVDEYFREHPQPILLNRIDYTGRIAVKPPRA